MPPPQALILARQKGLDLVEISPTAVPPVCRIMDYGKYQYQEQKRAREAKRHQKVIEVKEIKFRPKVDEHDYQFKKHHIERFIEDGDKVKATIFFRGREMAHPEIGHRILMRLIKDLEDVAMAETMPRQEGNQMHTILTGKKGQPKPAAKPKTEVAETVRARLAGSGFRVEVDGRVVKIGYKIREAQLQKVPYMLVVGDKEVTDRAVAVRSQKKGDLGARPLAQFVTDALAEVRAKALS